MAWKHMALGLMILPLAGPALAADATIEKQVAAIVPSEAEDRWLQIPWHTNLLEARVEAQRVGKPILLWVMNGNPLGCA